MQALRKGEEWSHCRNCGALIRWGEQPNGRPEPKNPDGTTHLATCAARQRRQRPAAR